MKPKDYKEILSNARDLVLTDEISVKCVKRFLSKEGVNASNQQVEEFFKNVSDNKFMEKHEKWLNNTNELQELELIDKDN